MSERDPIADARRFATALAGLAPPVPGVELPVDPSARAALARFRLGQVPDQGWAPSMAIVGRRAVGKSSLSLALTGFASTGDALASSCAQPRWAGSLIVHDTPGLRAAGRSHGRADLAAALAADPPDLMIAVFSATEVDAGVDDDVADLLALARAWTPRRGDAPALLAALHRVDELPPFDLARVADDPERAQAIATATRVLRARLSPLDGRCPVVPSSIVGGELDPAGAAALRGHARALLAGRLGRPKERGDAFSRALGSVGPVDDAAALARLRRAWEALGDDGRAVLLHPRGWDGSTPGRSERG
jgi:hypothetical protein